MKTIQIIFVTIVIGALVALARHYDAVNEEDLGFKLPHTAGVTRHHHTRKYRQHRRKRQYSSWNNYLQDYSQNWKPGSNEACPEKDILSQMMKIMTLMLQKESSPPKNVYVSCSPKSHGNPVDGREFEDLHNMNWGLYKDLNLDPYRPRNYGAHYNDYTLKSPPVNGVPRNTVEDNTEGPRVLGLSPNVCDLAYVACCDKDDDSSRQECFHGFGCHNVPEGTCDAKAQKDAFNFIVESYKLNE